MQPFSRTITLILFAAHALLGCCVHHACDVGGASHGGMAAVHADHHCAADHETSHDPAENGDAPVAPCDHESCSFVKVQPVRIDHGGDQILWVAAAMPAASVSAGADAGSQSFSNAARPIAASSVALCVRYCALLI